MNLRTFLVRAQAVMRGCAIVVGTATGATAITAAVSQDWTAALAFLAATAWAFLYAAHTCPGPEPVERGDQAVTFTGGPLDGGTIDLPNIGRDYSRAVLPHKGTEYRITTTDHTCYTAEATQ